MKRSLLFRITIIFKLLDRKTYPLEVTKQYSKLVALNIDFQRISFAVQQLVDRMESGMAF
jgi:hypothetical protein